ncbi:nucleotide exchange factor GrpE [Natronoglycomyces albus]|uniref:Protein GrpE n=1 Tax=Natronoglycomyces albus TaxID=2811108 RepID=A0A895XJP1_9ACTN|nr:nucleotide exchange factor GrpE [Natronoglycomyces albus]QSB05554.1 nucleotide exchange factor GrpE [Natronoglycomyces albus]
MSSTENGSSEPNGRQEAKAADDAATEARKHGGDSDGTTSPDHESADAAPAASTDSAADGGEETDSSPATDSSADDDTADEGSPEDSSEASTTDAEESEDEKSADDSELTVDDILGAATNNGQALDDTLAVLQTTVEERTRDLQRLSAEFQNYRKRVERDKARAAQSQTVAILSGLLPVLDDLDRAREHGDLTGPFGSVAEQLLAALSKHGLEAFGEKGDEFDPNLHEAVAHMHSGDVDGPTCIDVMRRGYRIGDKLVRAAMVAVAEPPEGGQDETSGDGQRHDDEATEDSSSDSTNQNQKNEQ